MPRRQSEEMVLRVTGGKPVPAEVLAQIVAKTDGIPLFIEELVKTILAAGLVQEDTGRYVLTGPLHFGDSTTIAGRADGPAGPVGGGERGGAARGGPGAGVFIRAAAGVAPQDEVTLQQALAQLMEAELLYQRGLPPHATYVF